LALVLLISGGGSRHGVEIENLSKARVGKETYVDWMFDSF